jgi:RND family efflux transporter MFP subunit
MNPKTVTLAAPFLALALLSSCQKHESPQTGTCRQEPGTAVAARDSLVPDGILAQGTAEAVRRADLSTRLMGHVLSVAVQEGQAVRAGQILARIDADELAARSQGVASALSGAQAQAELARTSAKRMRALYADSAVTRASLDQAEAELRRAEAGLAQVHAQGAEVRSVAGYASLSAPFSGRLTRRLVDPGALAAPGMPLLTVEDVSQLRVRVNAAPEAATHLHIGQILSAQVGGRGTTARIEGIVPAPVGNLLMVNALVENPGGVLPSGVSASLLLPRGTRQALLVPSLALHREEELTGVTVRKGSCDALRWVRVGAVVGDDIEVLSGLRPGESVVVPAQTAGR